MKRYRGNKTNYKQDRASGTTPYRKYVNWQERFKSICNDGLDSDVNRGKIGLPDPGCCQNCRKKIKKGLHKATDRNEDVNESISESTPDHR